MEMGTNCLRSKVKPSEAIGSQTPADNWITALEEVFRSKLMAFETHG